MASSDPPNAMAAAGLPAGGAAAGNGSGFVDALEIPPAFSGATRGASSSSGSGSGSADRTPANLRISSPMSTSQPQPPRAVEVLVHNVSHKDLLVSVRPHGQTHAGVDSPPPLLKPRYDHFREVAEQLLARRSDMVLMKHTLEGSALAPCESDDSDEDMKDEDGPKVPVGFGFNVDSEHSEPQMPSSMFESRDPSLLEQPTVTISGVYLPLLAIILPSWTTVVRDRWKKRSAAHIERKVVLVSGAGAQTESNSTERTARLMAEFIGAMTEDSDEKIEVVHITDRELFRFERNVSLVKTQLLPVLEQARRELAEECGDQWPEQLHTIMSICDGSSARMMAIHAGLRQYRPSYFHVYEMKSFYKEMRLTCDDLDYLTFDTIEARPKIPLSELYNPAKRLVEEMLLFRRDFEELRSDSAASAEFHNFWLRKTKKPVLSILMVQKKGSAEPEFHRGVNLEVSMPTGSLCSERNVIGSALAKDLSLRRQDMKFIAVLSLPPLGSGTLARESSNASTALAREDSCKSSKDPRSPAKIFVHSDMNTATAPPPMKRRRSMDSSELDGMRHPMSRPTSHNFPRRLLEDGSQEFDKALNPIAPCGACKEWLKKIVEVNPDFKVVTFTDSACSSVFISSVD